MIHLLLAVESSVSFHASCNLDFLSSVCVRLTVCFVVVACSDATVVLRALLLPSRLWYALCISETSFLFVAFLVIP